jgi:proline iminopeptidase
MLGGKLGTRAGQQQLHYLLADAFAPGPGGGEQISDVFLAEAGAALGFTAGPLYAVLHESIYAQGAATDWAAASVLVDRAELATDADPMCLLGEAVQPFFFTEEPALQPLAPVADLLAERADWPRQYDPDRLAGNQVPVYAAVYADDMFVPRQLSLRAAERIGATTVWLTDDYLHDGLCDGDEVLDRLRALAAERTGAESQPADPSSTGEE